MPARVSPALVVQQPGTDQAKHAHGGALDHGEAAFGAAGAGAAAFGAIPSVGQAREP